MDMIGVIPAAGIGSRMKHLPGSKELIPIGTYKREVGEDVTYHPKPVMLYLIDRMKIAGVQRFLVIVNREKWDLVKTFGGGHDFGVEIAYLLQEEHLGLPDAISITYPWVRDSFVVFGMPDTIFEPDDAFSRVVHMVKDKSSDLILGLFPTIRPQDFGMVRFDEEHNYMHSIDKPEECDLRFMWGISCWTPAFSKYLKKFVHHNALTSHELVLGDVFQAAHEDGLKIKVLPFENGNFIDIR